jgi:hypothetical protein
MHRLHCAMLAGYDCLPRRKLSKLPHRAGREAGMNWRSLDLNLLVVFDASVVHGSRPAEVGYRLMKGGALNGRG